MPFNSPSVSPTNSKLAYREDRRKNGLGNRAIRPKKGAKISVDYKVEISLER
jgi:hypothetical protein